MVRRRIQLAGIALVLALAARIVGADIVQPVSLQLREQEPNTFLVQWSAPQTYPVRALPEPALPEDCRPQGERVLQEQPGTWLSRQVYRCQDVIAGRQIGVHYPFVTAGQSAMIRIELLSGEQLVHALNPGEDRWLVPEIDRGLTARLWSNLRRAVLDGVRHFLGAGLHFAFWLGLCLAAGTATGVRLVTGFSVGQILGVSLSTGFGLELAPALAEGGVAISTALLAAQALRTAEARRQLVALTLVAGLVHGLGVGSLLSSPASFAEAEWLYRILAVAGMDAALLVLVLLAAAMGTLTAGTVWPARLVKPFAYGLGGFAVAAALVLVFANPVAEAEANATRNRLPSLPGSEDSGAMPGSRRIAPQGPQAAVQSFLSIEPFEVRHQVLFRLRDLATEVGLDGVEVLPILDQPRVKERLSRLAVPLAEVRIDRAPAEPIVDRIDFLEVSTQGVLPRTTPVLEVVDEAFLGITLIHLTVRTPATVELIWQEFSPPMDRVPATVSDPEFSQTAVLSRDSPVLGWQNNLSVDLVPTVTAQGVEPRVLPVPLLALMVLVTSVLALVKPLRDARPSMKSAWLRVSCVFALVVAPMGEVAVALPASLGSVPSTGEARRILAGVLPNVYRAFEFREESDAYDRLSVSVTGETLSDVYLEHRRALEMEERGGARARVEAVEVQEVRSVVAATDGGFDTEAVWVVGGTVTHFGHRHFRQNRYDARVRLVPVNGTWKIQAIDLFDEERLR